MAVSLARQRQQLGVLDDELEIDGIVTAEEVLGGLGLARPFRWRFKSSAGSARRPPPGKISSDP